jgi:hypothetical protein
MQADLAGHPRPEIVRNNQVTQILMVCRSDIKASSAAMILASSRLAQFCARVHLKNTSGIAVFGAKS